MAVESRIALENSGHYCGFFGSGAEALVYAEKCGVLCDALCKKREFRIIKEVNTGHDCEVILLDPNKIEDVHVTKMPFYHYNGDIRRQILDEKVKIIIP